MKIWLTLIFAGIITLTTIAQDDGLMHQGLLKLDNSYLFIDNSKQCWFTLQLKSDTIFPIENTLYFFNGKSIQISSISFESGNPEGISGSVKAEEFALKGREKWELDYQEEALKMKLTHEDELHYNSYGKPFLLWWYETPKGIKIPVHEIEIDLQKAGSQADEATGIEIDVTHQLFLNFIIHGNTSTVISIPVIKTETLEQEKQRLIEIANSLKVYGSYINLKTMSEREMNNNQIFRDSLGLLEIELPEWLNIINSPIRNSMFGTLPEKENIYNAVGIVWEYKTGAKKFEDYILERQKKGKKKDNVLIILDKDRIRREYYTSNNSLFRSQNIYLEGDNIFCLVNFTATATTYDFNLERFNELVSRIKLK